MGKQHGKNGKKKSKKGKKSKPGTKTRGGSEEDPTNRENYKCIFFDFETMVLSDGTHKPVLSLSVRQRCLEKTDVEFDPPSSQSSPLTWKSHMVNMRYFLALSAVLTATQARCKFRRTRCKLLQQYASDGK